MAGVTKEEIARAKELDLLTYFKLVEPGNLKLVGKEYRHKVHSSLTISKDSLWCWHWHRPARAHGAEVSD